MIRQLGYYIFSWIAFQSMSANGQEQPDSTKTVRLQDVVITASRLKEEIAR